MPLTRRHQHTHTHAIIGNPHGAFTGSDPSMLVDPSLEALVELPPAAGLDASTARKAQNRVAQREFRQRKQEYIRALECRVDLLSCADPVQIDRLRWMLRQLMLENAKLRVLLGVISAHVAASGAGGFLGAHPTVRTELERYVFTQAERCSIHSWDPHGADHDGHLAMHELAAQTAQPPSRASIHPHPLLACFSGDAPPRLRRTHTLPTPRGAYAQEPALKRRRTTKAEPRSPSPVPGPMGRRSLSHPPPLPSAISIAHTPSAPPALGDAPASSGGPGPVPASDTAALLPDLAALFPPFPSAAVPGGALPRGALSLSHGHGHGHSSDTKALFAAKYRAHMSLDRAEAGSRASGLLASTAAGPSTTAAPASAPASVPVPAHPGAPPTSPAPPSDGLADLPWPNSTASLSARTYTSPTLMPAQS